MAQAFGSGMQADAEPAKPARRKRPVGEAYAPPLTVAAAPTASVPGGFEMPSAPSVPRSVRLAFDEPAAAEAFAQAFSDPGTRQAAADAFAVFCAVLLRTPVNNIEYFPPNFEGLVLGCIDADFCK